MVTYTNPDKNSHRARILTVCENVDGYIVYLENEFAEFTLFARKHWNISEKRLKPVTDKQWKANSIKKLTGISAVADNINDYICTLKDKSCAYIWFDYCGTNMPYCSFEEASRCVNSKGGIAITLSMRCDSCQQDLFIKKSLKKIKYVSDPPIQYYGCSGIRNMKIWFSNSKSVNKEQNKKLKRSSKISTKQKVIFKKKLVTKNSQKKVVMNKTYSRPRGNAPYGFEWDFLKGEWSMLPEKTKTPKKRTFENTFSGNYGIFYYKNKEFKAEIVGKSFYDKSSLDMIIKEVDGKCNDGLCGKPTTRKTKDVCIKNTLR